MVVIVQSEAFCLTIPQRGISTVIAFFSVLFLAEFQETKHTPELQRFRKVQEET